MIYPQARRLEVDVSIKLLDVGRLVIGVDTGCGLALVESEQRMSAAFQIPEMPGDGRIGSHEAVVRPCETRRAPEGPG